MSLDGSPPPVGEHDAVSADAEATVAVERWLESFHIALFPGQVSQGASEPAFRLGRKPTNELSHLLRDQDPHSSASSADSGTNFVRPARWYAIAFRASGFARISIVSTIASR